jgi:8-oxo-dGTP pyrophosphatase MutT (NUDIX family)
MSDSEQGRWKVYGERPIYENFWTTVTLMEVEPPGEERFEHHVVRLHRCAGVVILDDASENVLMLYRHRFIPDTWGWEIPVGMVDPGETAEQTAIREVTEETGYRISAVEHLLSYEPMVGIATSPHELFVARGAEHVGPPTDKTEAVRIEWIPLRDVQAMISRQEIYDSPSLVGLLHVLAKTER